MGRQILEPDDWVLRLESSRPQAPPLPGGVTQAPGRVAELVNPNDDALRTFVMAGQPVLVRNWASHAGWSEVIEKWELNFFGQQRFEKLEVGLDMGNGSRQRSTLGDYVRHLQQSPETKSYLRLWHYEQECPELCKFFSVPACFQDGFERLPAKFRPSRLPRWVFIGPEGAYTPLHTDPYATHAWFLQVRGAKRFEIFHPDAIADLSNGFEFADLREHSADFPKAHEVPKLIADVGEGDLLFLPANWPHTVLTTSGPSISLTHNFLDDFGLQVVRTAFLLFKSRKVWRSVDADEQAASGTSLQSERMGEAVQKVHEQRPPEDASIAFVHDIGKLIGTSWRAASICFALAVVGGVLMRRRSEGSAKAN